MKATEYKPFITFTEDALDSAAREFYREFGDHRVIAFYGGMGAGKTTFIAALCREMGVTEPVTSPTFAIVNEYASSEPVSPEEAQIFHFDFYRIKRIEEAYDMGFEDYLYSGHPCFIEWPELIEELLPEDTLRVRIAADPDGTRTIAIDAYFWS